MSRLWPEFFREGSLVPDNPTSRTFSPGTQPGTKLGWEKGTEKAESSASAWKALVPGLG